MKPHTTRGTKGVYMSLGAVAVVMLLGAALVVPSSNAYAVSQGGNGKTSDNVGFSFFFTLFGHNNSNGKGQTNSNGQPNSIQQIKQEIKQDIKEIKDIRKELKDKKEDQKDKKHPDKCKPNKQGKYNKDCTEDQGGNGNGN